MEKITITSDKGLYLIDSESYQAHVIKGHIKFDAKDFFIHRSHDGQDYTIKAYGGNIGLPGDKDKLMNDVVETKLNEGWEYFVGEVLS